MKLSTLKATTFAIIAAALSTQAFADTRFDKQIEAEISSQQHQAVQMQQNDYSTAKQALNNKLAQLQQTSDMTTFAQLSAEAKDLAEQAKSSLASIHVTDHNSDNGNARLSINAAQWRLNNVISSLDNAVNQNDVTAAKLAVQAHI